MTSGTSDSKRLLEWPKSKHVYLTLDFECDYGTALSSNHYNAVRHSDRLVSILEDHGVPMSCFVQTEVLEKCPESVNSFRDAEVPIDFHAHSHTHPPRKSAEIEREIEESVRRVRRVFDTDPVGFRFPDGASRSQDYEVLADHGVAFSSSVFPSWRPGRFNNLQGTRMPHINVPSGVVELPFTVFSGYLRVPVALSYLKLFGAVYERLLAMAPPNVIVFDFHMHDLVVPPTFSELSRPYQAVYSRKKHDGFAVLKRFISRLRQQGYTFGQMTDLYTEVMINE